MNHKDFNRIVGAVFSVVFALHVLRLGCGWTVVMNGWVVPMWVSWVGLSIAGFLSWTAYKLSK